MARQDRRPAASGRKAPPRPPASAPPAAPAPPSGLRAWISRPWFAPALFALVALVYFWEFPLSGKIIFGQDVGLDFHRGKAPVLEKLRDLVPPAWSPNMGGYPVSEELRHRYFPTYVIELFTTHQRAVGWRYLLAVFAAGYGMFLYLRRIGVHRWAALWGGLAFLSAPTLPQLPPGRPVRQDVGHRPLPLPLPLRGARHGRGTAGPGLVDGPGRAHRPRRLHPPPADAAVRPPGHGLLLPLQARPPAPARPDFPPPRRARRPLRPRRRPRPRPRRRGRLPGLPARQDAVQARRRSGRRRPHPRGAARPRPQLVPAPGGRWPASWSPSSAASTTPPTTGTATGAATP